MKKILTIAGYGIGIVLVMICFAYSIKMWITDTKLAIIRLCESVCLCLIIGLLIFSHLLISDKQKCNWKLYSIIERNAIINGILGIMYLILGIADYNDTNSWSGLTGLGLIFIWSYLAIMLASKNALFILRSSYIIPCIRVASNIYAMSLNDWVVNSYGDLAIVIWWLLIIALLIKGLISTFGPKYKEAFPKTEVSYLTVLAVVILGFMILAAPNIELNLRLPFTNTELLHNSK